LADCATFYGRERRLRRSQKEGALQPYTFKVLANYAGFESSDVGGDIG
jgi:hypothetical protein